MKRKFVSLLLLSSALLVTTSCGEDTPTTSSDTIATDETTLNIEDTTPPVIESVTVEKDTYYTNEPFSVNVSASDELSAELTYVVTLTAPDETQTTHTLNDITLSMDGEYTLVVSVSDISGNVATSDEISITAYDPYAHWSEEESQLMLDSCGFILPRSMLFSDSTTVTQSVNLAETVLGVIIDNTLISEDEVSEYISLLTREGFTLNSEETAYYSTSILNSSNISVYDKNTEGYEYNLIQSYYYNEDFKIEGRSISYTKSHTWDQEFADTTLTSAYSSLVPAFELASDNEDGLIYLIDFTTIMAGAGCASAIQGKLFNVTLDEVEVYLNKLAEMGYTDGSIDDLIENDTTMPMYMDLNTYAMVMIQISSYLEEETSFFTLDIMCM